MLQIDGLLQANGANGEGNAGGGAGGSIQIIGDVIRGAGTVQANGGLGGNPQNGSAASYGGVGGSGGGGRIWLRMYKPLEKNSMLLVWQAIGALQAEGGACEAYAKGAPGYFVQLYPDINPRYVHVYTHT